MSYDPLRERVMGTRDQLKSAIRKSRDAANKAKIELDLLYELEAMLNLDAIVDALPEEPADGA
jgi:hypothetical protein